MKRLLLLLVLLTPAMGLDAQQVRKWELTNRIVDDLFALGSEADIPKKYAFLNWPALRELSRESNWPRLEFIRDISTVGDLIEVWPSREALTAAVYESMPSGVLQEYIDMMNVRAAYRARAETEFALDTLSMLSSSDRLPGELQFLAQEAGRRYQRHKVAPPRVMTKEGVMKAFRSENWLVAYLDEHFESR